jgi:tetratricopeptide (TPR) repeat protein
MTEPQDVIAYRQGVLLFKQGKTLEALEKFRFAAQTGEDRPMEHFALASAYMQVGDTARAAAEYQRFLDMNPGMPQREHAAHKVIERVEADEEQKNLQRLTKVRKLYDEAISFFRVRGYDSALERLDSLLDLWGRTPEVLNLKGLCHRRQGQVNEAISAFQEALEHAPDNPDVLLNLGQLFFEEGAAKAESLISKAVKVASDNAGAWHNLAVLALSRGDYPAAEKAWLRVLTIDPDDETARANIIMLTRRES